MSGNAAELKRFIVLAQEALQRQRRRKIWSYFLDTGPLRRELYPQHLQFFRNGRTHRISAAIAANRVGKTETMGCYELACHLTGEYPPWWEGRKFHRGVYTWAAGDTAKTVRDIIQAKLIGPWDDQGTGMILGDRIINVSPKAGVPQAAELISVRHVSGDVSRCVLKSYDQRREAFQGTEVDVILEDEEPPSDIHEECLIRTMTNNGLILATFTPLMGRTNLVKTLLEAAHENSSSTAVVSVTWDDVPHLSQEAKDELWKALPPFQRDARSKGIPQLGSGAIYPISEDDIIVQPFTIPAHWPRAYGLDVGWNRTAAVWGALDRDTGTVYLYHEHYLGQSPPSENARGIRAPGEWIEGAIDPAANGRSQRDGEQLIQDYRDLGLNLINADNTVEAGIYLVWGMMVSGRLKVFANLTNWRAEFREYQRDEQGRVVKKFDHEMDATRYLIVSGLALAKTKPVVVMEQDEFAAFGGGNWMA